MSISGRDVKHYKILGASTVVGIGNTINVRDYRNAVVKIGTAGTATLTCKAQGAVASADNDYTAPNFGAVQTVANNWDNIQMIDLNTGTTLNGNIGFSTVGIDKFQLYELNINGLDFINFDVTAYTAGSITIEVQLSNNI